MVSFSQATSPPGSSECVHVWKEGHCRVFEVRVDALLCQIGMSITCIRNEFLQNKEVFTEQKEMGIMSQILEDSINKPMDTTDH